MKCDANEYTQRFKSIPLCNIHVKDGNRIQCKEEKKKVFIKWVNTTLKMRIRQAHSIFLPKL